MNTLGTVKRRIQQEEDSTHTVVIRVEAAHIYNVILLDDIISEVALEEHEGGMTDQDIPIENNCMDDELHLAMPENDRVYEDDGDESDVRDAIPTASLRRQPMTQLYRFGLGTSGVNGYEGVSVSKPAFGLRGICMVIIGIQLQTWMQVIVDVGSLSRLMLEI